MGVLSGPFLDLQDGPAGTDATPVIFNVRPGSSARQVAEDLLRAGLIRSSVQFLAQVEASRLDKDLVAGDYELKKTMSAREVLQAIASGAKRRLDLTTIAEGWRAEETALFLEARGVVSAKAFMEQVAGTGSAVRLPDGAETFEGYLYPETYEFPPHARPDEVLQAFVDEFNRRVDRSMRAEAAKRSLSVHELVVLASIIEREAVEPEERRRISAVIHNRLRLGMSLQMDPTVQYALVPFGALAVPGGFWKAPLLESDLRTLSAYNTYSVRGLPPGPICSPGLASLQAAADPEPGSWLFFVARGDGGHIFAYTLEEHLANVARVRSRR